MRSLNDLYFQWLCAIIEDYDHDPDVYEDLLIFLFNVDFQYSIPRDGNRYADGIELRYKFGNDNQIKSSIIATEVDISPCSVLEMMIALSIRCEDIMDDSESESSIGQWFWEMIENLGLDKIGRPHFSSREALSIVRKLLEHRYKKNGEGGLFTVKRTDVDMRKEEIWYQAMWHLNEVREKEFL